MPKGYRIAIVGASTPVGKEIVKILEERAFPALEVVALEARGAMEGHGALLELDIPVRTLEEGTFKGFDLAFFASGPRVSMDFARQARSEGAVVIDLSVAFRMDREVPLVIPEINPEDALSHRGIIACPSAGAIQMALVLVPIHRKAVVRRVVASTYQAVSDAGEGAMNELTEQITELFNFQEAASSVFQHQIAFNVIPQVGVFLESGYSSEETGVMAEMRRMLGDGLRISVTTAHVPVFYAHSQSLAVETEKKVSAAEVKRLLKGAPGVKVEDKPSAGVYPLAVYAAGKDECSVGRIREDQSADNGIALWSAMDNVRKGAALNAVQIAELVIGGR
ncbi:MAG TPA: aspartate-semialdehyde dehydrogenase [Deltaproteobacteria bacterium]|jgi:aspartate-semialdehyde dehydrogenase|nr:aspartate-semialdehyde dehydrogenase [Deltaproteobacteria bacterium]HOI08059.1 aspartate-semialdehyde dehydrogenase [Deltaproteobacteria bacterium]